MREPAMNPGRGRRAGGAEAPLVRRAWVPDPPERRRDRDPAEPEEEPGSRPPVDEPDAEPRSEPPVDEPLDAPGMGEPARRDPLPDAPARQDPPGRQPENSADMAAAL